MADEFKVHQLNTCGLVNAEQLGEVFARCLAQVQALIPAGRELSLVVTKLQEASFFAKRAIAQDPKNQA
jgi:hypothetical protein